MRHSTWGTVGPKFLVVGGRASLEKDRVQRNDVLHSARPSEWMGYPIEKAAGECHPDIARICGRTPLVGSGELAL